MSAKWVNPARKEIREVIAQNEAVPRISVTVTKEKIRVGWMIAVGVCFVLFVITFASYLCFLGQSFPWNTATFQSFSSSAPTVHWVLMPLEVLAIVISVFAFGLSEILMLLHWALERKRQ